MSNDPAPAQPLPTCFVAMGFGKKTDFESGRVLDLNASYDYLIEPSVTAAGLQCIRADKIIHSGMIDVPMYEQLLNADVVVADLSTSNRNAIYELGIRHALRPYTTVIIAEEGLMKSPFFDLNHIVIRTYKHLGEDIGAGEAKRFTAMLTETLKAILAKQPVDSRRDSPVYTILQRLSPPQFAKESTPPPSVAIRAAETDSNAGVETYNEALRQADEAAQKPNGWMTAKVLLEQLREARKKAVAAQTTDAPQTAKAEDPTILQRLALATYKSKYPSLEEALGESRELLKLLEPRTSNDTETLGLWGSVHKQLWSLTKNQTDLDESVRAYERGFYLRNDYYNGINYAFLLNVRAANTTNLADAVADFVQARRVRTEVIEICNEWLRENPEPEGPEATEQAINKYRKTSYWVLATLGEAWIGLDQQAPGSDWLNKGYAIAPEGWMQKATKDQLATLQSLLVDSPLKRLPAL